MAVGIQQLKDIFLQTESFDNDPGSLDLSSFENNLLGVVDDFRNLRGNDARLQEMDDTIFEFVQHVDFTNGGLSQIVAHFLGLLFENHANDGRGYRKAYEFTVAKRSLYSLDGPFIYEELVPKVFDDPALRVANDLRLRLIEKIAEFLEEKNAGGHWSDTHSLDDVRAAQPHTQLLEFARRRAGHPGTEKLTGVAHSLEQRLAETGFFEEMINHQILGHCFKVWHYLDEEPEKSFWDRIRESLEKSRSAVLGTSRLNRWKGLFILQIFYMVAAVAAVFVVIGLWQARQEWQIELLNEVIETLT